VRLVGHECNLGIPKTRNKGIQLARGEYIAMLDSDDTALPDRLAKQVAFLECHKDYALVGSWAPAIDEKGQTLRKGKKFFVSPGEMQSWLLFHCTPAQSSIMARTTILQEYRYCEQCVLSEDFDLFVRLARKNKLGKLPDPLVHRRAHTGNITREKAQLAKNKDLEIVSAQLTELGMTFTLTDLERHWLFPKRSLAPDRAYLTWAEAWLLRLQAANQRALRYPEPPFAWVLGELWFKVCRRAVPDIGWTVWKRFWQSPLSKGASASLRRKLFLSAAKPLGLREAIASAHP